MAKRQTHDIRSRHRKRVCIERLGFPAGAREAKKTDNTTKSRMKPQQRQHSPHATASVSKGTPQKPVHVENTSNTIPRSELDVAGGRPIVGASIIQGYSRQIDEHLWPDLLEACKASDLEWNVPVRYQQRPSSNLRCLYQTCMGQNWHTQAVSLSHTVQIRSLDFLASVVGAAIYSHILSTSHQWAPDDVVSYRSKHHERRANLFLQQKGMLHRYTVAHIRANVRRRESIVQSEVGCVLADHRYTSSKG